MNKNEIYDFFAKLGEIAAKEGMDTKDIEKFYPAETVKSFFSGWNNFKAKQIERFLKKIGSKNGTN